MRVVMITKPDMDYSRTVDTFLDDFARQTGRTIEVLNPDEREGELLARAYDVVEYPTLLALSTDGPVQNIWVGTTLPTIDEVSYYASQD